MDEFVTITSSILEFNISLHKQTSTYVVLSNITNEPLAFKVKTTSVQRYSVRPSASVLEGGEQKRISFVQQAFSEPPLDLYSCRDRFQLLVVPLSEVPRGPLTEAADCMHGYASFMDLWAAVPPLAVVKERLDVKLHLIDDIGYNADTSRAGGGENKISTLPDEHTFVYAKSFPQAVAPTRNDYNTMKSSSNPPDALEAMPNVLDAGSPSPVAEQVQQPSLPPPLPPRKPNYSLAGVLNESLALRLKQKGSVATDSELSISTPVAEKSQRGDPNVAGSPASESTITGASDIVASLRMDAADRSPAARAEEPADMKSRRDPTLGTMESTASSPHPMPWPSLSDVRTKPADAASAAAAAATTAMTAMATATMTAANAPVATTAGVAVTTAAAGASAVTTDDVDYSSVEYARERVLNMNVAQAVSLPELDRPARQRVAVERAGELVRVINEKIDLIDSVHRQLIEARHRLSDARLATRPAYDVRYEINESAPVPIAQICIMAIISSALLQLLI